MHMYGDSFFATSIVLSAGHRFRCLRFVNVQDMFTVYKMEIYFCLQTLNLFCVTTFASFRGFIEWIVHYPTKYLGFYLLYRVNRCVLQL